MVLVEIILGFVKVGGLFFVVENIDIEVGCFFFVKFVFCGVVLCKFWWVLIVVWMVLYCMEFFLMCLLLVGCDVYVNFWVGVGEFVIEGCICLFDYKLYEDIV